MNGRLSIAVALVALAGLLSLPAAAAEKPPRPQRPVVVHVDRGGFDWADAAVGAAAALAVALLLVAMYAALRDSGFATGGRPRPKEER